MKKMIMTLVILIVSSCLSSGCHQREFHEVGNWETQNVKHIYSLSELGEMSEEQLGAFVNTYIKVKAKFFKSSCIHDLYYMVSVQTLVEDDFSLTATVYENYWEMKYAYGDEIYIEGYVYEVSDYSMKINPAFISKP